MEVTINVCYTFNFYIIIQYFLILTFFKGRLKFIFLTHAFHETVFSIVNMWRTTNTITNFNIGKCHTDYVMC
jgi:hypothetical protein